MGLRAHHVLKSMREFGARGSDRFGSERHSWTGVTHAPVVIRPTGSATETWGISEVIL
jgi:hypothetical protein